MREDENGIYQGYRVLRRADGGLWELGRGGMAVAYKAADADSGAIVALRVISPLFIGNDGSRARFIREAKAAAAVRHRNVARIHHLALDVRGCFYAMELLEGETLEQLVKRAGPQPWPEALALALQVNAGLAAAHEHGLIHRDLKPASILLVREPGDETAVVKLSDFALAEPAASAGSGPVSGTSFLVTALYASPEQCGGAAPDIRSNIYSLGLILWYLLTGAPPFSATSKSLFWHHQHTPAPLGRLPRQLPAPLRALLGRMLAKEPAERPQTPAELARELESCLPERPAPEPAAIVPPAEIIPKPAPVPAPPAESPPVEEIVAEQPKFEPPPAEQIAPEQEPASIAEPPPPVAESLPQPPEAEPAVAEIAAEPVPEAPFPPVPSVEIPQTGLRLRDCMRDLGGKLPAAVVANLLDPLAEIVDGAVAMPLELTPAGICLSLNGEASDTPHFGASFTDPLLTRGRPAWVEIGAPSQDKSDDSARERIPALAGLIYELLGGAPPAPGQPYQPLSECNAQGNAILQRALQDRPDFNAATFAASLGPELRTAPEPIAAPEGPKSSAPKIAAALVALLGVAAGAGTLLWWINPPGQQAPAAVQPQAPPATPLPALEPLLAQARAQMAAGQWREAAKSYSRALALKPDSLEALSSAGTAHRFMGETGWAQTLFKRAILLEPADAPQHLYRADAFACLNQPDKAKADYQAATAMDVGNARDFWLRGHAYLSLQKNDLAVMDFAEAIRLDPKNAVALVDRGNALLNLQKNDAALQDFEQAVRLNPSLAVAWTGRGYAHSRRREFAQALQDFDQSIRLAPKDPLAWNGRGVCHFSLQQLAPAVDAFNEAFRLNAQDPMILFNRGTTLAAQRKFDLAIEDFTGAIQLDPHFAFAFRSRGAAYVHLKQYDQALTDFDEAIRLQPDNADNFLLRGNGYNGVEKYDLAIADFDKAIRLNPQLAAAYAGRGYANESLEEYESALRDYTEQIRLNLKDPAAYDNRGRVHAAMHEYEQAIQDFNETIRLAPNFRAAYDHRAAANLALGRTAAARKDEAFVQLLAKP